MSSIILPEGILDLFDVTKVEEEYTGKLDKTGAEVRIIHIYLDERDNIDESMHSKDLFTFLSNKNGHGKHGTLIAAVRGTNQRMS